MQQYVQKKRPDRAGAVAARAIPSVQQMSNSTRIEMGGPQEESRYADALRAKFLQHQIPSAEREADQIAAGVTASGPEQVKAQMGEKMGADFSGVRFHTDAAATGRAGGIGARAFTTGRDVYFGPGGFDAGVAAHELVHTVQQGSVPAAMSTVSAPAGETQMKPLTGNAWTRFWSKAYSATIGSVKRSHARAREDVIRSKEKSDGTWKKLAFWRKAQYIATHPWAWLSSFSGTNKKRLNDTKRWDNEDARLQEYLQDHDGDLQNNKKDWMPAIQQSGLTSRSLQEAKGREPGEDGFYPTVRDLVTDNMVEDTGDALLNNQSTEDVGLEKKGLLGLNETANQVKNGYNVAKGAVGTLGAIGNIYQAGTELGDAWESGVRGSLTDKLADIAENVLEGGSNAFDTVKGITKFVNPDKAEKLGMIGGKEGSFAELLSNGNGSDFGAGTIMKGASAGLKFTRGLIESINNGAIHSKTKSLNQKWDKAWEDGQKDPNTSDEDKERNKVMHQSSFFARKNAKANVIKGVTKMVDAVGDVGSMINPIPLLGSGISVAQKGVNAIGNGIASTIKKNTNTAMLNEEMNLDDRIEAYAKELLSKRELDKGRKALNAAGQETKWNKIGERKRDEIRRVAKHIILKAHGFTSGKRSEAAGNLILNRSKYLTNHANDGQSSYNKDTTELINAMGVKARKDGYNEDDVANQMGLEGGSEGLTNIRRSRSSTLKWYARKGGVGSFLRALFMGGK